MHFEEENKWYAYLKIDCFFASIFHDVAKCILFNLSPPATNSTAHTTNSTAHTHNEQHHSRAAEMLKFL